LIVIKFKNAAHDYRDVSVDLLLARPHSTPWKINSSTRSERVCVLAPLLTGASMVLMDRTVSGRKIE